MPIVTVKVSEEELEALNRNIPRGYRQGIYYSFTLRLLEMFEQEEHRGRVLAELLAQGIQQGHILDNHG